MQFINNTFFGIFVSVVVYLIGLYLFNRFNNFFLFQPLFVGMVLGIFVLWVLEQTMGVSSTIIYDAFWHGGKDNFIGANLLFWFLGPATISFAIPLYKRNDIVKDYWVEILLSLIVGLFISLIIIYFICRALNLSDSVIASLLPQSATTAIALPLSTGIGGIPAITAMTVILNSVIVLAIGDQIVKWLKLDADPIGVGLGLGTSGHTIGSAKAVKLGSIEGAMASIAVIVVGIVTNIVVPLFARLIGLK
ncbi:LrgB family protein [Companilactobacillus baiquanensis]|uniref:LrgB family protein n=1 Tax=Companilactobacillus baiquanensis TaxID=2486005 RepID=A0ABW1UXE8_9LACO|nr:LrgB family protein [Companilactobacillus baiquanensis]